jgi:hypothetical protein
VIIARLQNCHATIACSSYHRVITDVLLRREEVIHQWPGIGPVSSLHDRLPERAKSRPAFERARRVIDELYPGGVPSQAAEPNASLCQHVGAKLKEDKLTWRAS